MSYFSSFFGATPAQDETEEARQRELRRRKAAAEARKKREEEDDDDDIAAFSVSAARRSSEKADKAGKAAARVVSSRPAKTTPTALPAINEESAAKVASAQSWSAVTSDPEEMKRLAARAQAAQEKAVADLMEQVREQQQQELSEAIAAAREETKLQVQQECEAKHEAAAAAAAEAAAKSAAEAQASAVSVAVAEAEAAAAKRHEEAMTAAEARHAEAMAAAEAKWEQQKQHELHELSDRLEKQHQATLVTSAAMVRNAETEGESKRETELRILRAQLASEHAADKEAAVLKTEADANGILAQVRIDAANEKTKALAEAEVAAQNAVIETEAAVTARLEAAHRLEKERLAERQKAFNVTFKKLMQELVDQPDRLADPRLASPTAQEAALAIKYES